MNTSTHTVEDPCFSYHAASAKARDLLREHSVRSWSRAVSQETMHTIEPEIPTVALGQVVRRLERDGISWDPRESTLSVGVEISEGAEGRDGQSTPLAYNSDTHTYQDVTTKAVTTLEELDSYLTDKFKETLNHVAFYMAGSLASAAIQ